MKFRGITTPFIILTTMTQHVTNALEMALGGPTYPVDVMPQNYTDKEGAILQGFLSVPSNSADVVTSTGSSFPAVIVLHDQSGPDTYEQQRATMMAKELGYVGFAADVYGEKHDQSESLLVITICVTSCSDTLCHLFVFVLSMAQASSLFFRPRTRMVLGEDHGRNL